MIGTILGTLIITGTSTRYVLYKICGSKKTFDDFWDSDKVMRRQKFDMMPGEGFLNFIIGVIIWGLILFFVSRLLGNST